MSINLLFTCAGRRTYLLRYFKEQLGHQGKIIGADMQLSAPALSVADIKVKVPSVYAPDYIDCLIDISIQNDVKAIISLNDLELPLIAAAKKRFASIGVTVIVSSPDVINICFDKYESAKWIESIGLKTPKTYSKLDEAISEIYNGNLSFPLVLKPRWGSGSIGIEFVDNEKELKMVYDLLLYKIKKSILAQASQNEDYILVQERIIGSEYGLDVMNDLNGCHLAVSAKKKLAMRAGETDKAEIVADETLHNLGKCIATNLKHIGNLDVDILEREGQYYILELNPRFGGGFPFSYEAGVNYPKVLIDLLQNKSINHTTLIPRCGEVFAKCDYLVKI